MAGDPQANNARSSSASATLAQRSLQRTPSRAAATALLLPLELEFVVQHGVSLDRVRSALEAAPLDGFPAEVLLGEGLMLEEEYYQALAHDLGCSTTSGPPVCSRLRRHEWTEIGRCASRGAPRPTSRRHCPALHLRRPTHPIQRGPAGCIRRASRSRRPQIASLVRIQHADAVLRGALGRLPAAESARTGLSRAK